METSSQCSIQALVTKIKEEMFSSFDLYPFVSPSAYDTAWLAMIPCPRTHHRPVLGDCFEWVLNNQRKEGFWGEVDGHGTPTIDTLPATLACMVALRRWNVGDENIGKGLAFIHANADKLLQEICGNCPRWFAIVFPAMVELAQTTGLEVVFPKGIEGVVHNVFCHRQRILETEQLVDKHHSPPLISYLETLPLSYDIKEEDIVKHLSEDGSLFQSPSATASAFMATGNEKCMGYLQSLVQRCPNGVPPMYPMDEEFIKLCMVEQIQRLGIAEHFVEEIEVLLTQAYSNYMNQESAQLNLKADQIYKDSLAFLILRMHGYRVSPRRFCWFLHHEDILAHIEKNCEYFSSVMLNVYRAADLMFLGEDELEEARSFARKLLEKTLSLKSSGKNNLVMFPNFRRMIEHELNLPWIARLDHLDHREWIEKNEVHTLWMGKASFYRLLGLHDGDLMQLAVENYLFRQSIYKNELEKLKSWAKVWGLSDMGFGREKTSYCYFAVAASSSFLPPNSDVRMIVAKSAIIITVADDFYDMEGSLDQLISVTGAVERWDGKGLSGHGKIIFDALDNLVRETAAIHLYREGSDITEHLRRIWHETFDSWLIEATWSKTGHIPSIDEYIKIGATSIAAHTIALPASCFMSPSLPNRKLKPAQHETLTKLLMVIARLLNDTQSYQKEQEEGKMFNAVLLFLREHPEAEVEDAIAHIRDILDKMKKEFVEHVLIDGSSDLPSPSKLFHLSCLKVFQMFFNSSNGFDSDTQMIPSIQKAIYVPPEVGALRKLLPEPEPAHFGPKQGDSMVIAAYRTPKHCSERGFAT